MLCVSCAVKELGRISSTLLTRGDTDDANALLAIAFSMAEELERAGDGPELRAALQQDFGDPRPGDYCAGGS
jgi:hypothetical protein